MRMKTLLGCIIGCLHLLHFFLLFERGSFDYLYAWAWSYTALSPPKKRKSPPPHYAAFYDILMVLEVAGAFILYAVGILLKELNNYLEEYFISNVANFH